MLDALDALSDEEVVAELKSRVARCDCLVVIVGFGRGSTPELTGLEDSSFTAVEYETASRHHIPILVFHIQSEAKPIRVDLSLDIQAAIRSENVWVEQFKKRQLETHITKTLKDLDEFQTALVDALILQHSRAEFLRANTRSNVEAGKSET
jgi:hypothetical protein